MEGKPSEKCLSAINRLKQYDKERNEKLEAALRIAKETSDAALIAEERRKAAEQTLSNAIVDNANNESNGGSDDNYPYTYKN